MEIMPTKKIEIEEISVQDLEEFWKAHISYLVEDGIITDQEDIDYFSGAEYRGILREQMRRDTDRQHMVWFNQDGTRIGAASYCTYQSEDGKCFILDFWVFPDFRNEGNGHLCFEALEEVTRKDGAEYYQINSTKEDSVRLWKSLGFIEDGADEWDVTLYTKKTD